jgi:hypothetical protein
MAMRLKKELEKALVQHIFEDKDYKILNLDVPGDDQLEVSFNGDLFSIQPHLLSTSETMIGWTLYLVVENEDGGNHGEEVKSGYYAFQ